jgi:inhibitor of the pro-sigma K processing machinery
MESILTLLIPLAIGYLVYRIVKSQVGCIWKFIVNSLSGFACLWLLNLLSGYTGIVFEINLVTCLLTGILGIPGIILLAIGQLL